MRLLGLHSAQAMSSLGKWAPAGLQYRRVLSASCAIGLQFCFVTAFGTFRPQQVPDGAGELRLISVSEYQAVEPDPSLPPEIALQHPDASFERPPRIDLSEAETGPQAATGSLPARPDPGFANAQPPYPQHQAFGGSPTPAVVVIARILVLADGAIGEAVLAGSCGRADLDAAALSYVKRHWRFLPATQGGAPIKDWITVEVYFRSR